MIFLISMTVITACSGLIGAILGLAAGIEAERKLWKGKNQEVPSECGEL